MKYKKYSVVILLLTSSFFSFAKIHYNGNQNITVVSKFESANSFISYITIDGQKYILKQKKEAKRQAVSAMRDALAAYIARDLKIAHYVQIIPATDTIPGKMYQWYPATLVTIAPGKMIKELSGHKYFALSLKQRDQNGKKITGRWLTEEIINQITWHKQLAIIVALDLFISNTDRHGGNLFYDEATDSFCAIDMDNIYRRNLPALACHKLNIMINVQKKQFTQEEIKALTIIKNTLKFLLKKYTPEKIIDHLHYFAYQAGYINDGTLINNKIAKKIAAHEVIIRESYIDLHRLVIMLDDIIKKI